VIQELDVQSIFEVPNMLHEEGVDRFILKNFGLSPTCCDLEPWKNVVAKTRRRRRQLTIAVVGKYVHLQDAYKSVYESLEHGAIANCCKLIVLRVDPELIEKENVIALLKDCKGVLVPGGFGNRGILGKLLAIRHAREMRIPYFGICLGMQLAVVEFARNVAGLEDAHSLEFEPTTAHPVIILMDSQRAVTTKGGTMRLGHYICNIASGTLLYRAYNKSSVQERHRHRYEFNNYYGDMLTGKGLVISGIGTSGLVEAIEIPSHPWFVGVQFHPEFQSTPHNAHPLFGDFIAAALKV
jgi:CTP synthase